MRILLHSNGTATHTGDVSEQLLARLKCLTKRYWEATDDYVERVYFFGKDRYPNGVNAHDVVQLHLRNKKILENQMVIRPIARNTPGEVQAFLAHLKAESYTGRVGSVTSEYNEARVRQLFAQRGRGDVEMFTTTCAGFRDVIAEPLKYVRDCGIFGSWAQFAS